MNSVVISILSGLGGMFGWGLSDFFGGLCSKKIGPLITLFWSQTAALFFSLFLILFFAINLKIPLSIILLLPIASLFYAATILLFYKGFEKGTISIVAATVNLWAVFAMLIAYIFLDQRLSKFQFVGVLMIITGVTLVSLKWSDIRNKNLHRSAGIKETVLAAFFFGVYFNLSEIVVETIGWLPTTLLVKGGIVFYLLLFSLVLKPKLDLSNAAPKTKLMVVLIGALDAVGNATVNYGLTAGDAILITPIASALSIVTIVMAILFMKERITKPQGLGIITAISGIIFTAF